METGLREMGHAELQMTELEEIESLRLSTEDWILIGIAINVAITVITVLSSQS
jgi:hypothetical protein